MTHTYQYKLINFIFIFIYKYDKNYFLSDFDNNFETTPELFDNERIRARIFKEFKKEISNINDKNKYIEFKNKLKNNFLFEEYESEKLREISQWLENLKIEAELNIKEKIYKKFFYNVFKICKFLIFLTLGKIRVNDLNKEIEKV